MEIKLDELMTIEEVAAKLKVKVRTVRDWRAKRKLPFTRIGRRLYVPVGAVEELLKRNTVLVSGGSQDQTPSGQGGGSDGGHNK